VSQLAAIGLHGSSSTHSPPSALNYIASQDPEKIVEFKGWINKRKWLEIRVTLNALPKFTLCTPRFWLQAASTPKYLVYLAVVLHLSGVHRWALQNFWHTPQTTPKKIRELMECGQMYSKIFGVYQTALQVSLILALAPTHALQYI
jgi:hypothetical protein